MKLDRSNLRPISLRQQTGLINVELARFSSRFPVVVRRKLHVWLACPAGLLTLLLGPIALHANTSCESLTSLVLPDTAISSATAVSPGPFAIPGPPPAAGRPDR